jgi:hypothetical protein
MQKQSISLVQVVLFCISIISIFLSTPFSSNAYFTTDQDAVVIPPNAVLFSIDYAFGHKSRTVGLPLHAQMTDLPSNDSVSYLIYDENGAVVRGKAVGIVLSDAKLLHSGSYKIEKGVSKKFTLYSVFIPDVYVAGAKYRLQVTNLPFTFNDTQELQLNPTELKYYTTPFVTL